MPLLTLRNAQLAYGLHPLLDDAQLQKLNDTLARELPRVNAALGREKLGAIDAKGKLPVSKP